MKTPERSEPAESIKGLVNREAERALLGRILANDRIWWDVADKLQPSDFGHGEYGNLFRAMAALVQDGRTLTPSGLLAQLGEEKIIDTVKVSFHLQGLLAEAGRSENLKTPIQEFIDIILHRSGCRQLATAADVIKAEAIASPLTRPIEDIRQNATRLLTLSDTVDPSDDAKLGDLIADVILGSETARKTGKRAGIQTGFAPFDELVGSLLPGNLIIIAGETGSGKTALATQLGISLAEQGIGVRMTSLEMESKEIATRVLATYSAIEAEKIGDGQVTPDDLDRMMATGQRYLDLPFWIDSRPRQTTSTIQARLARAQAKHGVKVGIVDHLQYVRSDLTRSDERERITQVVDDHKAMAKRLQMVLILLSHVSRQVDFSTIGCAADIKRPTLNNLFGSSAIEKASDATVFVHRPHWFLERATPTEKKKVQYDTDLLAWEGKAELVMPKRRSGKGFGVRTVYFNDMLTWFSQQPAAILDKESDIPF